MNKTYSIEFLVYIAGVWVPAKHISIQTAFNSLPRATISLPADVRLFGIGREDRVPVHIFLKDTLSGSNEYMLMFEGEVKSFGYTSSSISREVTISAQSNLSFLMDVKAFFMHSINQLGKQEILDFEKNQGVHQLDVLTFPHSLFMRGLTKLDTEGDTIEHPSEFLYNLYRYFHDWGSLDSYNDSALAKFYSEYSEALGLKNKMVKVPIFDDSEAWENGFPLLKGMQKVTAIEQMVKHSQGVSNPGKTGDTIYNWLNYLVTEMQYEMSFIAAPSLGINMGDPPQMAMGSSMLKPMMYEAHPPECNFMFAPHVDNVRTTEDVYQVPTRIIVDNTRGTIGQIMANSPEHSFGKASRTTFYPSGTEHGALAVQDDDANNFTNRVLPEEQFTGPYLYETQPPAWTSYVNPHIEDPEASGALLDRIMAYLLQLKKYERRSISVSGALNPFVVPGFPGVVFDSEQSGFKFCGYVMAVQHSISKTSARTEVSMGFTRLLDEAISDPLINPSEEVNTITTDSEKCSEIYEGTIGSRAVDFSEVVEFANNPNRDSATAYQANHRDIITMEQYFMLLNIEVENSREKGYGEDVPLVLSGPLFDNRRNSTIRDTLLEIAEESLENNIY